jgi:hypothetical protein
MLFLVCLACTLGLSAESRRELTIVEGEDENDTRFPQGDQGSPDGEDTGDTGEAGDDGGGGGGDAGDDGGDGGGGEDTGSGGDGGGGDDGGGDDGGGDDGGDDGGEEEPAAPTEVCYPGADESWTTCLDVVPWSSSWGSDYSYPSSSDPQYAAPVRFVDLAVEDPDLALAPNFVLDEFMQEWKGQYAIYQPHTVEHMQAIRDRTGSAIYVNSGYRNVSYNADVGGAEFSRHMYGDAADFYSNTASLSTLSSYCYDEGAGYVEIYTSHVHCDWRDDPLETAFYDSSSFTGPITHDERSVELLPGEVWTAQTWGYDEGEPLLEWRALDADGEAIDAAEGLEYVPPDDAARVELTVAGNFVIVSDR